MFYEKYWLNRTKRSNQGGLMVKHRDKICWIVIHNVLLRFLCSIFLRFYLIREIFVYNALKKFGGSFILDLGCGEGALFLNEFGGVIGIDIAVQPLFECKKKYDGVVCASALHLPFRDESFDFVKSTDFIGHIRVEDKGLLFNEMDRVLMVGGYSSHIVETDSSDSLFTYLKKYPEAFKEAMFNIGGHVGLESCRVTIERFQKHFTLVNVEKAFSSIHETEQLSILLKPYVKFSNRVYLITCLCERTIRNFPVRLGLNLFLSMLSYIQIYYSPYEEINGLLITVMKN